MMPQPIEVFLSASVPIAERKRYFETADVELIGAAINAFATTVLGRARIIFGGHPSITPLLWSVANSLGVDLGRAVVLYQSKFFEGKYPKENSLFPGVEYIDAQDQDLSASLALMRTRMLGRAKLTHAVFIGGMEGVQDEYAIYKSLHPSGKTLAVAAPGGASAELVSNDGTHTLTAGDDCDFVRIFHEQLEISASSNRELP